MKKLVWLHLSDIHFLPFNEWKDSVAQEALLVFLKEQLDKHKLQIDLIFCTGDIAFGKLKEQPLSGQYEMARAFFNKLLALCGCDIERLFIVPGNHDIDRSEVTRAERQSWGLWGSEQAESMRLTIPAWFASMDPDVKAALRRLTAWGEFIADYLPHQLSAAKGHHHYAHTVEIRGYKVGIAGFNSAWTCADDNDDRVLWLAAEPQFNHMRQELKKVDLKIGLIHHPWDWFNTVERGMIKKRITQDMDFWLHGHTHDAWVEPIDSHVTLAAGAVSAHTEAEFGFNLVELDFAAAKGQARLYCYKKEHSKWAIETVPTYADYGIWPFALPHRLQQQGSNTLAPVEAESVVNIPPALRTDQPLPARPACLFRAHELQKLAAAALMHPPQPVLLHGHGGMGKTEIATRFLCSDEALRHFGAARYFLSVEVLENAPIDELASRLHELLARSLLKCPDYLPADGIGTTLYDQLRVALVRQNAPALLVLDNFETLFQRDAALANATLDRLTALANNGLSLLLTVRDPLPHPRALCLNLRINPFDEQVAARGVLLHWAHLEDAILGAADEQALQQLLNLAEGYPIQLQMLGMLADGEGLQGLARRCPDSSAMAAVIDSHGETDRHRHPTLSFDLTWHAPRFTEGARSLLRALAPMPDGVADTLLNDWPDQEAVRNLMAFKLLLPAKGRMGEARLRLLSPFRQYLLLRHPHTNSDIEPMHVCWNVWLRRQAPELFDTNLDRKNAAWYRDLDDSEVGSLAVLRSSGVKNNKNRNELLLAVEKLQHFCGEFSDWKKRVNELKEAVIGSCMFATRKEAEFFSMLLVGSVSLPPSLKNSVAEAFKLSKLDIHQVDDLKETFLSEISAWAWEFNSFDLAFQIANILAEGRICFHAPVDEMIITILEHNNIEERIALLFIAGKHSHTNEMEQNAILNTLKNCCDDATDVALAYWVKFDAGLSQNAIVDLKKTVELSQNYGRAWTELAKRLPENSDEAKCAWQEVLLYTNDFLTNAEKKKLPAEFRTLHAKYQAMISLNDKNDALDFLRTWSHKILKHGETSRRIIILEEFIHTKSWKDATQWLLFSAWNCNTDRDAHKLNSLANIIGYHHPDCILRLHKILHERLEMPGSLSRTAILLLELGLAELAEDYARLAARSIREPYIDNDLAYLLLTCDDTTSAMKEIACELAIRTFNAEPNTANAETLLCGALHCPSTISSSQRKSALDSLLAPTEGTTDPRQLAGLILDAKHFESLSTLNDWLSSCSPEQKATHAWHALDALLHNREPAELARTLHDAISNALGVIEDALGKQAAWRKQHASALTIVQKQAQDWLAELYSAGF